MDVGLVYMISGLLGIGYYLNKDGRTHIDKIKRKSIPEHQLPSGQDTYNSRHLEKVWGDEFERSTKNWNDSKDPVNTNIIPAIAVGLEKNHRTQLTYKTDKKPKKGILKNQKKYGQGIIQKEKDIGRKIDSFKTTPSSTKAVTSISDNLVNDQKIIDYGTRSYNERRRNLSGLSPINEDKDEDHGGWKNFFPNVPNTVIDNSKFQDKGQPGKRVVEYMYHNNMEPFFGGSVKQNMDPKINRTTLETYTGTDPIYSHKREIKRFFPIEKNPFTNGLPVQANRELDRYIPSNLGLKTNQLPFEQIKVPPGLNKDPNNLKSNIGFHDPYRPQFKTTNELRVNPKSNYKGRVVGKKFFVPGRTNTIPVKSRRAVDLSFTNDPNDKSRKYRPIVSNTLGGLQRPTDLNPNAIVFKTQERDQYAHRLQDHGGPGIGETKKDYVIPHIRISNKPSYKSHIIAPSAANKKDYTIPHIRISNRPTYRVAPRFVKKSRDAGQHYNYDDLARTTIKEQTVNRKHSRINVGTYKDIQKHHYDKARITTKEQFEDRRHPRINVGAIKSLKTTVYDPENWKARITNKEQIVGKNVTANVADSHRYRNTTHLFDKSRITQKEQIVGKNVTANVAGTHRYRNTTHLFDKSRITQKEQLVGKNVTANVSANSNEYRNVTNPLDDARITVRQQISGKNVTPNVDSGNQYRHITNPLDDARITIKQQTQKHKHSHINPEPDVYQPKSRQDAYNAEINALKELTVQRRKPVPEGTKVSPGKYQYNVESTKLQYNIYDKTRRIGKIWGPTKNIKSEITAQGQIYCDKTLLDDRINPEILKAFKDNPYTQSLESHQYQFNPPSQY